MPYRVERGRRAHRRSTQRGPGVRLLLALLITLSTSLGTSLAAAQEGYTERFEQAWRLVSERYWDLSAAGVDWESVGDRYRGRAQSAESEEEFYSTLEAMYEELDDDHSVFVPPSRVEEIRAEYGALPCLPVLAQAGDGSFGRVGYELIDGAGYLEVPDLASPGVATGVRDAVRALEVAGAAAIVMDLRGNPGGRLVEMMQVAGVFTNGFLWRVLTNWSLPLPYPALGGVETDLPLLILTDGDVNSAAEGLAGALQQRGRAIVVGETTAGNVEAILPFCLRDGSQAWIATGVLAPIGAPTWEGRGVEPDVAVPADDALDAALEQLGQE